LKAAGGGCKARRHHVYNAVGGPDVASHDRDVIHREDNLHREQPTPLFHLSDLIQDDLTATDLLELKPISFYRMSVRRE